MLQPTHFVYDTNDEELLPLHKTKDEEFIYHPDWHGADCWLSFIENKQGLWQVTMTEAIANIPHNIVWMQQMGYEEMFSVFLENLKNGIGYNDSW